MIPDEEPFCKVCCSVLQRIALCVAVWGDILLDLSLRQTCVKLILVFSDKCVNTHLIAFRSVDGRVRKNNKTTKKKEREKKHDHRAIWEVGGGGGGGGTGAFEFDGESGPID